MTLNRRFAYSGLMHHRAGGYGAEEVTPRSILGSLLFADYWAADRFNPSAVNPRITASGGLVSAWPEEIGRNGAFSASGSNRPTLSATSFGGRPGITFDGSANSMISNFGPTMAAGARIYVWVVGNWTTTIISTTLRVFAMGQPGAGGDHHQFIANGSGGCGLYGNILSGGGSETNYSVNPTVIATDRAVYECGLLGTTTAEFRKNGVATNGTNSNAGTSATSRMYLGSADGASKFAPFCFHRVIIGHNVADSTQVPTSDQLAAMLTYLSSMI